MAKKREADNTGTWRDRVLGFERIAARDLYSHDGNWRVHPQFQQDALQGILAEIGIAGALLVYRSAAQGGALVTIDGHLRKALNPEQEWPCLVLDVDDAEAATLLATHDPIAAYAQADTAALTRLLAEVQSGEAGVQALLSQLAQDQGIVPPEPPDNPAEHWQGMPDFQQEDQTSWKQIIVHFATPEAYTAFARLVEMPLTEQTKSVWYPPQDPIVTASYEYRGDESTVSGLCD